jgi:hypothetical protein
MGAPPYVRWFRDIRLAGPLFDERTPVRRGITSVALDPDATARGLKIVAAAERDIQDAGTPVAA